MFLSTRSEVGVYKFILNACIKNYERLLKKKIEILIFEKKKFPSLKYFFFFTYIILSGKIFRKDRYQITYSNIEIGRFVLSSSFQNFETYTNKFKFYKLFIKNLFLAGCILKTCNYYYLRKNILGAYIDHCGYMNGIIFSFLAQKRISVYTNNYPHGIYFVNYKKNKKKKLLKYENTLKINIKKNINFYQKKIANKQIEKLVKKKNFIPWLVNAKFKKLEKVNFYNFDYIIYTHSFTDGQMWYGYDGFENTLDWLVFTLETFVSSNKKILIKPHPNFYNSSLGQHAHMDNKIYNLILKKYKVYKNFYFLKNPIHNYKLLKKLNKNCVAISKFGSVILETAYLNFKSISSLNNFYDKKFEISNMWRNKEDYLKLLKKDYFELNKPNKDDLYKLIHSLFNVYYSCYNLNNFYANVLKRSLKTTENTFENLVLDKIEYANFNNYKSIIKRLSNKIWEVKY